MLLACTTEAPLAGKVIVRVTEGESVLLLVQDNMQQAMTHNEGMNNFFITAILL